MQDLSQRISEQLPKGQPYQILYFQSKPTYVKPLINIRKSLHSEVSTIKIRHFLSLIDSKTDTIIFGIEILVYLTVIESTIEQNIFVAKCDTVGLHKFQIRIGSILKVFLQWLINFDLTRYNVAKKPQKADNDDTSESSSRAKKEYDIFETEAIFGLKSIVKKLAENPNYYASIPYYSRSGTKKTDEGKSTLLELPDKQTINISLFTKAAKQYLFPYSYNNRHKHLVNGVQLLNWWLKVIDGSVDTLNSECKLMIPGLDEKSTAKFIQGLSNNWTIGHIFNKDDLAIYNIPLFPDDPKGRYLEHLIVENNYQKMKNDEFYEQLGFRQEFRLGDVVGLIGLKVGDRPIYKRASSSDEQLDINVVPLKEYKQLLNLMKSENYSIESDIRAMVRTKIPEFCSKNDFAVDEYIHVIGTKEFETPKIPTNTATVNSLSVRKKPKPNQPPVNDLNNLIKRKKK